MYVIVAEFTLKPEAALPFGRMIDRQAKESVTRFLADAGSMIAERLIRGFNRHERQVTAGSPA